MEIVAQVVNHVVNFLMVTITKHVDFFVCSTKNVKAMDAKKKQLNETAQDMQDKKERADANDKVVSEHVTPWLEEVKELNEDAENIQPAGIGCFNVAKRYKAGKKSCDILEKLNDLETRASKIEWINELIPLGMVVSSPLPSTSATINHDGTPARFESRELIVNDALKFLGSNDETKKMMALCGMGGVGKTTMMEQLRKVVEDSRMFDWVVKVVIGENTDPIAFQKAIAEKMGEDLTETTKDARAERLCRKFAGMSQNGEKKILVIMDDLWKEIDLEDIGLKSPLPKGLKFLFTSRFEDVCSRMGVKTDSIFKIGILKDAEAKGLFFGIMDPSISNGDNPELQKIGEDIVNKCRGLPIAIVTIAKSLRDDIKEAWEAVRSRLQGDDLEDLDSIVKTIFEMSYENLKKDIDKSIFLLSGLFPEDFDISTEELLRYGWGLGFFKNVETLATARRDMKICVNNLLRANLLIESDHMGCVKMHDLMRSFALSNFSKVKQASIADHDSMSMWLTEDANESCERILLNCKGMSEFPTGFNYPDLSVLLLIAEEEHLTFPKDFYERMGKLEVVSYESIRTPLLPVTLENATKLRTLCLHSCVLGYDLSFLGSLCNLETLSIANCNVRKLPSTIGKLKKLKLLDLTGCVSLLIDDGVFENLVSLEELYLRSSTGCPIKFTDANCKELEKLSMRLHALELEFFENTAQPKNVSFEKLGRFRISIGCELEDEDDGLFKNTLNLVSNCNELLECKISGLFDKTEELLLQVNDINSIGDVSMHHSFSNLTVLHVHDCAELTYLFTIPVANGFRKLTDLTVRNCPVLKALFGGDVSGVEVIKFPELKIMCLDKLPKLISLWDTSFNVIELPKVVKLLLTKLPNFTSIFPNSSNTEAMQSVLSKEVVIPNLEILHIDKMENLEQIWPCQMTTAEKNNVSMVKEIRVAKCNNLVNLFPSNPLPLLNHLEDLRVRYCESIEVIFNLELEHVCEMEEYSSRLRKIEVERLGKLRKLWRMKGVDNSDILINGFKGVESIRIVQCCEFKYIFTPTTANFDLGALTSFSTSDDYFEFLKSRQESIVISEENFTYTSQLLRTCHHLQKLELADKKVEVVFDMDSPSSSTQLSTNQQPLLLLPYLEDLKLHYMENISHVWKCNWNKFLIPQQPPFHNLKNISLNRCHKIKYFLSPLMGKFLSNLKYVEISICESIEEVISNRDDEKATSTFTSSHTSVALFPHLETLSLYFLECLKRIDGGDASSRSDKISFNTTTSNDDQFQTTQVNGAFWSLCQYPRKIFIGGCQELSSLIPRYAVGQLKNLEELKISDCRTFMEVFESQTINNITELDNEGSASGGTTLASPRLKRVTVVPQLSNLKVVHISNCDLLLYVFTFSALESLKKLKTLTVESCRTTLVIVEEELGEQMTAPKVVEFPRLETLELVHLSNLKGFFLGKNHEFQWPLLDKVKISDCPKMIGFTSGPSKAPKLKYMWTELGKHSLECGLNFQGTINQHDQTTFPSLNPTISEGTPAWSFHNLIEFTGRVNDKKIISSNALLQVQKLEKIHLDSTFMNIEEVFEVEALEMKTINYGGFIESQTVVKIPNLREVDLKCVHELKYLWKSNLRMVIEFPKLTRVSISWCESFEHIFTCSMVGSLVHLQDLHIGRCEKITEIVKEEEEEVCDAKVNDIIRLPRLKSLSLTRLESLKGFCLGKEAFSWPSLNTLKISECPAITVFTEGHLDTPELKEIDTSFGMCDLREDVNSFIKTKQEEGCQF